IEKLFATAYTANRLKREGAVSDTLPSRASRDQAMAFYQNFYHPENTVVTIVGDIFPLKALGQVQLSFGNFNKPGSTQHHLPHTHPHTTPHTATNKPPQPRPPPTRQPPTPLPPTPRPAPSSDRSAGDEHRLLRVSTL